jgi:hypothetical protein
LRTGNRPGSPASVKAIALAIVALFCFQLSRVYFVDQVDAFYTCPYTQVWTSTASDDNETEAPSNNTETFEGFLASNSDDGTTVRSCKNSADGLGLSPVQPLGTPVAVSPERLEASRVMLAGNVDSAPDTDLPPLFQPPRSLS